jgi:superfamily I DNA/RNA helicase
LNLSQTLLAELTDEQRALARRESRNLYVIKGAAGSGKTVVGIRRIAYLCEQRNLWDNDKPILFVCYNKVLANAARQMIEATLGQPPEDAGVEIWTAYELLVALQMEFGVRLPKRGYVGPERLLPLIAEARGSDTGSVLVQWSDRALLDEILEVIYGRGLTTLVDYRGANRKGRGRPLRRDGRQRAAIWMIHERLRKLCSKRATLPWDDLPVRVAQHLAANPPTEPRFSAVIVDEAQDLLPSIFRVLLQVQAGSDDNMLVLGDAAQNVYRSGFRWGHTGLNAKGKVTNLRTCFRSTPNIIAAAVPLVSRQQARLEGDLVVPEGSGEAGPKVTVTVHRELDQEMDEVALRVEKLIGDGVPPSSIAVLIDNLAARRILRGKLEELECSTEDFIKPGADRSINIFEQSVKLLSVASAKGIEFQYVFVADVTAANFPAEDEDGETADRARRVLYTAMTRCSWNLQLSASGRQHSPLLSELDRRHVEYINS